MVRKSAKKTVKSYTGIFFALFLFQSVVLTQKALSFLYVCMMNTIYLLSFVDTPRKFIIVELSIRKLGSSSVLIVLLALMKIRAYGSKALQ